MCSVHHLFHPSSFAFSLDSFLSIWAKWILDVFTLQLTWSLLSICLPCLCVEFKPLLRAGVDRDLTALFIDIRRAGPLEISAGPCQVHLLRCNSTRTGFGWCTRSGLVSWTLDIGIFCVRDAPPEGNSTGCCEGWLVLGQPLAVEGGGRLAGVSFVARLMGNLVNLFDDFHIGVVVAADVCVLLALLWVELLFELWFKRGPEVLCLCLPTAVDSPSCSNTKSLWLFRGSSFNPQQHLLKISKARSKKEGRKKVKVSHVFSHLILSCLTHNVLN